MRTSSLSLRLFVVTAAWSIIVLAIAGVILSSLYRNAVERSFDARLQVYLKTLIASVSAAPTGAVREAGNFGEPRFDLPLSGWYWQIRPLGKDAADITVSASLWDQTLPDISREGRAGTVQAYIIGPGERQLRIIQRRIDFGSGHEFDLSVAVDAGEIAADITAFTRTLLIALVGLGMGVVVFNVFQVRYGLRPLREISEGLARVRSGRSDRLEGRFPDEIRPLADEVNALIAANIDVVQRARTHVGNLAHALKTPLSVLGNEARASDTPLGRKVSEQTAIMRQQIQHHLDRARAAARIAVTTEITDVQAVLGPLVQAMHRIHRDAGISIRIKAGAPYHFLGERQDLEEMLGNLIDNACKWAGSTVLVELMPDNAHGQPRLRIIIDDDGPGMNGMERDEALKRGQRLDESKPGSGLGLAIVMDLAGLYGGSLTLGVASLGGLRAELVLPGH